MTPQKPSKSIPTQNNELIEFNIEEEEIYKSVNDENNFISMLNIGARVHHNSIKMQHGGLEQHFSIEIIELFKMTMQWMGSSITIFHILQCSYDRTCFQQLFKYLYDMKQNQKNGVRIQKMQQDALRHFVEQYQRIRRKYKPHIPDQQQNRYTGFIEFPQGQFSNNHLQNVIIAERLLKPIGMFEQISYQHEHLQEQKNKRKKKKKKKKKQSNGFISLQSSYVPRNNNESLLF